MSPQPWTTTSQSPPVTGWPIGIGLPRLPGWPPVGVTALFAGQSKNSPSAGSAKNPRSSSKLKPGSIAGPAGGKRQRQGREEGAYPSDSHLHNPIVIGATPRSLDLVALDALQLPVEAS